MRIINVDFSRVDIPSYDSVSEAISAEESTPRAKQSAMDSPQIAGQFITDFSISDPRICLHLINGQCLELVAVGKQVNWRIFRPVTSVVEEAAPLHPDVCLVWPDGGQSCWNPASLVESRRCFPVTEIFAGQIFVNVYFEGGGVLQFLPLWNRSEQSHLLYVSELEPPRGR